MLFGCSDDNNTEIEINKQIESSRSVPFRSVMCVVFVAIHFESISVVVSRQKIVREAAIQYYYFDSLLTEHRN